METPETEATVHTPFFRLRSSRQRELRLSDVPRASLSLFPRASYSIFSIVLRLPKLFFHFLRSSVRLSLSLIYVSFSHFSSFSVLHRICRPVYLSVPLGHPLRRVVYLLPSPSLPDFSLFLSSACLPSTGRTDRSCSLAAELASSWPTG